MMASNGKAEKSVVNIFRPWPMSPGNVTLNKGFMMLVKYGLDMWQLLTNQFYFKVCTIQLTVFITTQAVQPT